MVGNVIFKTYGHYFYKASHLNNFLLKCNNIKLI